MTEALKESFRLPIATYYDSIVTSSDDTWRLLKLIAPEKASMSAAVGLLAVSSAVTMSVPFLMGKVIDIINSHVQTGNALDALNPISQVKSVILLW